MLGPGDAVTLAWHALFIGIILFLGFLLSAIVGDLLGGIEVLSGLAGVLAETLEWTGIVTAVLYAFREA